MDTLRKLIYTLTIISACSQISYAQDIYSFYINKSSLFCGIKKCEEIPIYNECESPECGPPLTITESCGKHWTGWHSVGGGHGNPCPSDCQRVGGSLGYDYRVVGFPPRPQEKNLYECQKIATKNRTCADPSCGPASMKRTGNAGAFDSCNYPANGIDFDRFNAAYETASKDFKSFLDLVKLISVEFERNTAILPGSTFDKSIRIILEYLNIASPFPEFHVDRVNKIRELLEKVDTDLTPDLLQPILSDRAYITITDRIPLLKYSCEKN